MLAIGSTIARLRRERGITQEQLAQAVGVSAPAVSKWETGQSYPDITLLPPLARYFGVTVDALIAFEQQLSEEALDALQEPIRRAFAEEGWAAGLARCQALMREYPSDMQLRIFLTGGLMECMVFATSDAEREEGRARQIAWLSEAASASEGKLQLTARHLLGVYYLGARQLDKAEEILADLSDLQLDTAQLMPTLRMLQERYDEAMKLAEQHVMAQMMGVLSSLSTLTTLCVRTEDPEAAMRYARAAQALLAPLGLEGSMFEVTTAPAMMRAAQAAGDAPLMMAATERYVEAALRRERPKGSLLFPHLDSEEGADIFPARDQRMADMLLVDFRENPSYDAIRGMPAFDALLSRLEAASAPSSSG